MNKPLVLKIVGAVIGVIVAITLIVVIVVVATSGNDDYTGTFKSDSRGFYQYDFMLKILA